MSLRAARKQATREAILASARRLFLEKGVQATSIEEIADAAGISRASLFNYYRGKGAIIDAMAAGLEQRVGRLAAHYLDKPLTTRQRIDQLFSYAGRVLEQTGDLARLLFVHSGGETGFPQLLAVFTELVEAGQRRGEVRADLPAELLAETLQLGFIAALLGWCERPGSSLGAQLVRRAGYLNTLLAP